jgi:hypothetical protein
MERANSKKFPTRTQKDVGAYWPAQEGKLQMGRLAEDPHALFRRVISVELEDSDSAERLAQELSDRFPAAVLKQDGHWDVAVYRAGADSRVTVIAGVLDVLKPWLRTRGLAAARLRIGERRTYLLEAEASRESVASH